MRQPEVAFHRRPDAVGVRGLAQETDRRLILPADADVCREAANKALTALDAVRLTDDNGRRRLVFELGAQPRSLRWDGREATLDGLALDSQPVMHSQQALLQGLDFATPPPASTAFPMLRGRDVLRAIVSGDQSR